MLLMVLPGKKAADMRRRFADIVVAYMDGGVQPAIEAPREVVVSINDPRLGEPSRKAQVRKMVLGMVRDAGLHPIPTSRFEGETGVYLITFLRPAVDYFMRDGLRYRIERLYDRKNFAHARSRAS